jgi:hypothetical protein
LGIIFVASEVGLVVGSLVLIYLNGGVTESNLGQRAGGRRFTDLGFGKHLLPMALWSQDLASDPEFPALFNSIAIQLLSGI